MSFLRTDRYTSTNQSEFCSYRYRLDDKEHSWSWLKKFCVARFANRKYDLARDVSQTAFLASPTRYDDTRRIRGQAGQQTIDQHDYRLKTALRSWESDRTLSLVDEKGLYPIRDDIFHRNKCGTLRIMVERANHSKSCSQRAREQRPCGKRRLYERTGSPFGGRSPLKGDRRQIINKDAS